ncbi:MAG: D-sedoheptulose 7-phosphate isomerase [Lachnospiraceae bacterium]|nr:D-sedoheptulose 7-phosphate isomerase [Lachnospiraceae bacterium]
MENIAEQRLRDSIEVKNRIIESPELLSLINKLGEVVADTIKSGNKLILCGNGGSASDALHFAGEIVGRFQKERSAWPAIVLNADVATMTAIANDYSYDDVFARQAEGHVKPDDLFIGISTSGNSENVYRAIEVAKGKGAKTAALVGKDGGKIAKIVDYPIVVPSDVTARIQESHICIIHIVCEIAESELA